MQSRGVFFPGQIFVFGGFILRANSLGHLEQIKSYAPGHQVRFGSLNYTANIRGDLIFDGFKPSQSRRPIPMVEKVSVSKPADLG